MITKKMVQLEKERNKICHKLWFTLGLILPTKMQRYSFHISTFQSIDKLLIVKVVALYVAIVVQISSPPLC